MKELGKMHLENGRITEIEMLECEGGEEKICSVTFESYPTVSSLIRSVIWLPENWNGVLVGLGNGGVAGKLDKDYWNYTKNGYAAVQTDMGTSLVRSGERTTADAELWKDYVWRSTHIMTETAKKIIQYRYGKLPEYSYFIGASAGGIQAFSEAQRFPEDYDGIIAGVPSNNALNLIVYFLWLHVHLHKRDGKGLISNDEAKNISLLAAEFFGQRGDGEPGDDFVTWPYSDENTTADFLEFLKIKAPQLTQMQLDALKAIYEGPKHGKTGKQIFCGIPFGAERNSGYFGDSEDGSFGYPWMRLFFGEGYDDWNFDFADDYDAMQSAIGKDFTAINADLSGMRDCGAKFLVYSGAADPAGPWADAVEYYNRVCELMGGFDKVENWFRFFILPGKGHGNGGLGVNTIWADESRMELLEGMRLWREKGIVPETLTGAHISNADGIEKIKFIRKIKPYRADKVAGHDFPVSTNEMFY